MREGSTVKPLRRRACQHRWVIETPHGATSRGYCKRCGAKKRFPNAAADALWNVGGTLGRWANRRTVARPKNVRPGDRHSGGS